jgi:hypothetical protein
MKTIIGKNKNMYLISELNQHYDYDVNPLCDNKITEYIDKNKMLSKDYKIFAIPDKSIICTSNIPSKYENKLMHRLIKQNDNIIDLNNCINFTEDDYYKTDTHVTFNCGLRIVKEIIKSVTDLTIENINIIDEHLAQNIDNNFLGDLSNRCNLLHQINIKSYRETNIKITNKDYVNYIDKINELHDIHKKCDGRKTLYVSNENALLDKKILIYGGSSVSWKMFEFISFYFKETLFYWNKNTLNDKLYELYKPDIFIEIRIERFFYINKYKYL